MWRLESVPPAWRGIATAWAEVVGVPRAVQHVPELARGVEDEPSEEQLPKILSEALRLPKLGLLGKSQREWTLPRQS